jgi:hypothetical protein
MTGDEASKLLVEYVEAAPKIASKLKGLEDGNAALRAEVEEWLCSSCNTVYPGPPAKGFSCVVCPKCGGNTGPKLSVENAALRAESAMFKERWELEQIRYEGISSANDELRARVAVLEKGLMAVDGLIGESRGVDGLHLNGDVALWEDLRTGGVYEEWLRDYDAALDALKEG